MRIQPVWAIFSFVISSILVAGAYHSLTLSKSEAVETRAAMKLAMPQWTQIWGQTAPPECYESANSSRIWKDVPPIFRQARYRHGGDIQLQCLKSSVEALPSFEAFPEHSIRCGVKASADTCDRSEELQVSYNVILDLTDCFELAQREFIPLLASQAGPRADYLALDQDQQPGLMRVRDWQQFQNQWPQILAELKAGEKSSCRRLNALFDKTLLPEAPVVCQEKSTAQESLIVLLAAAHRFRQVTDQVRDAWDPAMIDPKMAELDTRIEDRMILRYWTHLLAYFGDSESALQITTSFAEQRRQDRARIQPGELSWTQITGKGRSPASLASKAQPASLQWSQHLSEKLDPVARVKIDRVARWLNWAREQDLSAACATELWTFDMGAAAQ